MAITRTPMIDDDGSGTTGTIFNAAWKDELYNQIDANTADPAVLAALGMTPDGIQLLLRQRRMAPLNNERLGQLAPMLGPARVWQRAVCRILLSHWPRDPV